MSDMDDGLDKLAPGAGQAAQTGREMAQRLLRYSQQNAAIGCRGLLETFDTNDSPLSDSWTTRIVGGLAGAAPALPNTAGAATHKAPWWRRLLRRFGR